MNRTTVFLAVALMATVSVLAAGVIAIVAPEGFLTFTAFIGTSLVAITGFALSLYGQSKLTDKVEKVEAQTNGRLTSRDREIAQLQTVLIANGHADEVAKLATLNRDH